MKPQMSDRTGRARNGLYDSDPTLQRVCFPRNLVVS